jgi:hypothetical protein
MGYKISGVHAMTVKERVLSKIESMNDNDYILPMLLKLIEQRSMVKIDRIWKGRPVIKAEELEKIDCPYPREPEWEKEWEEWEKNKDAH